MMRWLRWAPALGGLAVVLAFLALLGLVTVISTDEPPAGPCGVAGAPAVVPVAEVGGLPVGSVAGYSGQQLQHAATIMRAGAALGLSAHGQTVGVMTAMGESSLVNVDYGDRVGPDSRGLFQQRSNGAWGSYADRMDPHTAATNFFRALLRVEGWESLPPTLAANRTQRNADPWHYERFWAPATQVVAALGGGIAPAPISGAVPCQDAAPIVGGSGGWIRPAVGAFTSGYGPRWGAQHNGIDIGAPCGTAVLAAGDGIVVGVALGNRSPATGYGTLITIDHGGGVFTRYAHAANEDVLVTVGQQVVGGDQIARVGTYGDSTGCHLHWEVQVTERGAVRFADPVPFMAARGVDLRGAA